MRIVKTKKGTVMVTTSDFEPSKEKKGQILTTESLPNILPIQRQQEDVPESKEEEEIEPENEEQEIEEEQNER